MFNKVKTILFWVLFVPSMCFADVLPCTLYHNNGHDIAPLFRLEYVQDVQIEYTAGVGYSVNVIADDGKKQLEISFRQESAEEAKLTRVGILAMRDECLEKLFEE